METNDNNFSIIIDHELKIIRYTHYRLICALDIEKAWSIFLNMKEFTELNYNLLSDYRGGKFQMSVNVLPEIIKFIRVIENIVKGKKQALIVDDPYSVAGSMLFESKVIEEIGFIVKVFSTEVAALKWLAY